MTRQQLLDIVDMLDCPQSCEACPLTLHNTDRSLCTTMKMMAEEMLVLLDTIQILAQNRAPCMPYVPCDGVCPECVIIPREALSVHIEGTGQC